LDLTPKARETKMKISKWEYITLKSLYTANKQLTKLKGKLWNGKKYLQIIYLVRD